MSLYITKENQDILWNAINRNLYIRQFLDKLSTPKRNTWFRDIIQHIYSSIQNQKINIQELNEINKSTIRFMIEEIRSFEENNKKTNASIYTPPIQRENKTEIYANEFEERQRQYQQMVEKKVPEDIDFRETDNDNMPNMEDLMKKQMAEREQEIKMYQNQEKSQTTEILKIDNSQNIQIEAERIETPNEGNQKGVSWSTNIENNPNITYKKCEELEQKIDKMMNEIDDLKKQNEKMQKKIDEQDKRFDNIKVINEKE